MIDIDSEFMYCVNELMRLGKRAVELSIHYKSFEPNIGIFFASDGLIRVEFYSYCLTLDDGSRHHEIESNNILDVVNELQYWVALARSEVKELEDDYGRD
jgi:hypothetical protein